MKLCVIQDVAVSVHWSLLALLLLVAWSLASGVFPTVSPTSTTGLYWAFGLLTALFFVFCIVLHELAHTFVASLYGTKVKSITLWIFGGVALTEGGDLETPSAEFFIASAGPLCSAALGGIFWGIGWLLVKEELEPTAAVAVFACKWLGFINLFLAGFNLIPAFPLDGGRLFRAAVWKCTNNKIAATKIAAGLGIFFGVMLSILGVALIFSGDFIGGLWNVVLGLILTSAAQAEKQAVLLDYAFKRIRVADLMSPQVVAVTDSSITVSQFFSDYVLRYKHTSFPVTNGPGGPLVGMATLKTIQGIPLYLQEATRLSSVLQKVCVVSPDESVMQALHKMNQAGATKCFVTDVEGHLIGILSASDIAFAFEVGVLRGDIEQPLLGPRQSGVEV